jgi:hypothetical protein
MGYRPLGRKTGALPENTGKKLADAPLFREIERLSR